MDQIKLSEDFLTQYRYKQPKWGFGGLGYIIYLRTYARKKADGKLERWDETVERITNGNFKIEANLLEELGALTPKKIKNLTLEAERFYHLVFNLVMTPPGRGLWMSGTEYAEKVGDAENNCWGISMRPASYFIGEEPKASFPAVFTFDQAMKGGGVGVNLQEKYVSQMPKVKNEVEIVFYSSSNHPDYFTELDQMGVYSQHDELPFVMTNQVEIIQVEDSRQGWAKALGCVIDAHFEGVKQIVVDVSDVRERGAAIVSFGGEASGPSPLVDMLTKVNMIINKRVNDFVSPTQWGDIIQNIGCCVVSGNVRRTAIILIGDETDKEFVESKNYSLEENKIASQWRWASNNSVDIGVDTNDEILRNLAINIFHNGEPGYTNIGLARNFGRIIDGFQLDIDGEVEVFNPCGEIPLPFASPCNLFELNLPRIHELISKGIESNKLYEEAAYLATRYAYRITFRPYEWEATRKVVARHRRLGIGITGITDWVLLAFGAKAIIGFDKNDEPIFNKKVTKALDKLYGYVKKANIQHAKQLRSTPSIKLTTVKPSGTVSLLMGVSPGQHFHWSAFMIRRVRMSANAPLIPLLIKAGYTIEPAIQGYDEKGQPVYNYQTLVVEFPVKAPTATHPDFQSAKDVPLKEQAALQALLASYWSDNAVSATLSFHKPQPKPVYFGDGEMMTDKFGQPVLQIDTREEEAVIDEITDVLSRYKTVIKSTSLLPHSVDTYPQMPYEEIDKDTYDKMAARITVNITDLIKGDMDAEEEDTTDTSQECIGGSCPIK
jgi:adenosylcobalamin-dependent ribonucleoside-triphosphate reductase